MRLLGLLITALTLSAHGELSSSLRPCPEARPSCRDAQGGVCLRRLAEALPEALFEELRQVVKSLPEGQPMQWIARGAIPSNVFEKTAIAVAQALDLGSDHFASVEYWDKSGLPGDNWHFDSLQDYEDCAAFPYVSTILYLDDRGPPTLLFSKTLADSPVASPSSGPANDTTYLAWPSRNHLLEFSGDLYHGIHLHKGITEPSKSREFRNIVLFNFWAHALDATASAAGGVSWESPMPVPGRDAVAKEVPLLTRALRKDDSMWLAQGEEVFGASFEIKLKYGIPGTRHSIHGCTVQQKTWKRSCEAGEQGGEEVPLLLAVPSSLKGVKLRASDGFKGDLFSKRNDAEVLQARAEL